MAETKEPKTKKDAISAPPEPSQMGQDAMAEHARTGGSTFDPRTGKSLTGTRNIAVGMAPEHALVTKTAHSALNHDAFTALHSDILSKHANSAVGTHYDQDTGTHHMEIVGLTPSKDAAMKLATHLGEKSVHNLATNDKIPTGNVGDQQISNMPIDQRFEHLRQLSPKREPYLGTSFSATKLDKIEGARRGDLGTEKAPATNADAVRVNLGSKTGMGVDAPAGFYSTRAGHAAPTLEAAKPHAHVVSGNFALASTDHPVFQQGYASGSQQASAAGADPKTAHQLGLNAGEHALSEHGFDGYIAPKHPGITFHFGDHEVQKEPKPQEKKA